MLTCRLQLGCNSSDYGCDKDFRMCQKNRRWFAFWTLANRLTKLELGITYAERGYKAIKDVQREQAWRFHKLVDRQGVTYNFMLGTKCFMVASNVNHSNRCAAVICP